MSVEQIFNYNNAAETVANNVIQFDRDKHTFARLHDILPSSNLEALYSNWLFELQQSFRGSGVAMPEQTREEIDAKFAAVEARTDTKIVRIDGKLELILTKMTDLSAQFKRLNPTGREDARSTRNTIWGAGVGLAILIVAVAALFPVFFGVGTQVRDIIDHAIDAHIQDIQGPKK